MQPALAQTPAATPRTSPPAAQAAPKPTGPAASQPGAPVPGNPDYAAEIVQTPGTVAVPPPLPPAVWDVANAQALLAYIGAIGGEGLDPEDYSRSSCAKWTIRRSWNWRWSRTSSART